MSVYFCHYFFLLSLIFVILCKLIFKLLIARSYIFFNSGRKFSPAVTLLWRIKKTVFDLNFLFNLILFFFNYKQVILTDIIINGEYNYKE